MKTVILTKRDFSRYGIIEAQTWTTILDAASYDPNIHGDEDDVAVTVRVIDIDVE